jgi:hypothetical protein
MAAILNSRQPVTPFARTRRLSSHSILTRLANFPHNLYRQLPLISSFPLRCVLHWEAVKALPRVYQAKGTNSADSQLLASCPGCNGDNENTEWEGYTTGMGSRHGELVNYHSRYVPAGFLVPTEG